jgi:hypothetical protein
MSKTLSGEVGSGSRVENERGGKTPLTNATNCIELRNTQPSATKNRTFLTLAIPCNFARVFAPRLPLRVNSARLHEKQALAAKNMKSEKVVETLP